MPTPVSIVLPCFNAARFLAEALDSIFAQTHGDFELVAVNDGSTDGTLEILESYRARDGRMTVISRENRGVGRSANEALERCRHEWVARMDADDVMMPNRLERQLAFVSENPDLAVASALVRYINEKGEVIWNYRSTFTSRAAVAAAVKANILVGFHQPAALMRRSVVLASGGYRPGFNGVEDTDLWNRIVERDPANPGVLVQPEYLLKYRIHGSSMSVASAPLMTRKVEWVAECMTRRRAGKPEPTLDQYLEECRTRPWSARLNRRRKETARTLYKSAVCHYSNRSYVRLLPPLLGAAILEPGFVLARVMPRIGIAGKS